jgi:hypothetical protein
VLHAHRFDVRDHGRVSSLACGGAGKLPHAARLYRQRIIEGLDGDPRAAGKARVILRELFSGQIRLQPQPDGSLLALWNLQPAALLRAAGTCGSGGVISDPATTVRLSLVA